MLAVRLTMSADFMAARSSRAMDCWLVMSRYQPGAKWFRRVASWRDLVRCSILWSSADPRRLLERFAALRTKRLWASAGGLRESRLHRMPSGNHRRAPGDQDVGTKKISSASVMIRQRGARCRRNVSGAALGERGRAGSG